MGKAIIITGTPGTGKTVLAKELSLLLKKKVISTTKYAKKHSLFEEFDENRDSYVIDPHKLASLLEKEVEKSEEILIIEGHLSHFMNPKNVELCLVCKTELPSLKKRLKKRNYSEEKIRENLDAEIFEICLSEAVKEGHNTYIVDTSLNLKESVKKASDIIKKHLVL